ncbi:hypothetical protein [Pannonibacter phragmitetus]|uniref:hypothetical protein n=1 Tax=Pannonibacter phragmitetus TaxID=121719 RepID=UPI000B962C88|nr:hypothetical protein [Pannonibacter phragmitetus]
MSEQTSFTCLLAWRSGELEFSNTFVDGAILVCIGQLDEVRDLATSLARHAHDGETLLVPGVPEAGCDMDAVDAFISWRKWFRDCATRRGVEMVMWGGPAS